jgi:hypothetical protein
LKKCIYIFPLSSTHLWLRYSNVFNPSKENYFGCAADRKIGKAKDLSAPLRYKENYFGCAADRKIGKTKDLSPPLRSTKKNSIIQTGKCRNIRRRIVKKLNL